MGKTFIVGNSIKHVEDVAEDKNLSDFVALYPGSARGGLRRTLADKLWIARNSISKLMVEDLKNIGFTAIEITNGWTEPEPEQEPSKLTFTVSASEIVYGLSAKDAAREFVCAMQDPRNRLSIQVINYNIVPSETTRHTVEVRDVIKDGSRG